MNRLHSGTYWKKMMKLLFVLTLSIFSPNVLSSKNQYSLLKNWSVIQDMRFENQAKPEGSSLEPLDLVLLREYENAKCLDGTPFGYYVRRANPLSENREKWIVFLQGGGLCVEPIDCIIRKNNSEGRGSSSYWESTFNPGESGLQDIVSDDPNINPYFYNFNHVYLRYCSGDTWTGTRTSFDLSGLWFSGHNNIKATIDHLNKTTNFPEATDLFLVGESAGGIGVFNNADYFREKWISRSTNFKAAPMCGMYFPGDVVLYPEWLLGFDAPFNSLASAYLSSWYGSAHDESCMDATHIGDHHRCWDASYLYNYVDTRLFMVQNRYDYSISQDVLLCPYDHIKNNNTRTFIEQYGDITMKGLSDTVRGERGISKGDGLFSPSCSEHTEDVCMRGGPTVDGRKVGDMIVDWYKEEDPNISSLFQVVDTCNDEENRLPCNSFCQC